MTTLLLNAMGRRSGLLPKAGTRRDLPQAAAYKLKKTSDEEV